MHRVKLKFPMIIAIGMAVTMTIRAQAQGVPKPNPVTVMTSSTRVGCAGLNEIYTVPHVPHVPQAVVKAIDKYLVTIGTCKSATGPMPLPRPRK